VTRFGALVERVDKRIPGSGLPLLSVSQTRGVVRRSELTDAPQRAESLDHYKVCRRGDIVFNKMSIRSGAMGVAQENGLVTYHYEVMRPRAGVDARFVFYLMKSANFTAEMVKRERGIAAGDDSGAVRTTEVPFRVLRTIDTYVPTADKQRAVADFLDRETAQIDTFIAKNEDLIALLTECRAAVIARAVLRGLDQEAQFRDSGVAWLGQVPSHWKVARLSRWFDVTLGKMLDESKFASTPGDVLPYVRASNIKPERLELADVKSMPFTRTEETKFRLRAGDLLVVEGGSIGVNAPIDEDMPGWGFQKTVNRVSSLRGDLTRFLGYQLDVLRAAGVLDMTANVSTIQHLTAEKLERLIVAMPPQDEQVEIVRHIALSIGKIDGAVGTTEEVVRLARERRAALISATVTGKIDLGVAA
jgi:type I restriction enzyme S subunit